VGVVDLCGGRLRGEGQRGVENGVDYNVVLGGDLRFYFDRMEGVNKGF
jgi:hypothetical protein